MTEQVQDMQEVNQEDQVITFTVGELNQILTVLGEAPAKYNLDVINFIRGKAQQQLQAAGASQEVQPE